MNPLLKTINMHLLLRILLAIHLSGLVIMAGTTVVDYFTFKTFCRMSDAGDSQAQGLLPIMSRYGELVRTGAVILIFTGFGLLVLAKGVWWEQLWFKIKMGLVVLLIVNGMFVGNTLGLKFRKMAMDSTDIRISLNRFYLAQLTIFLLIILVSVIRPDRNAIK